MNRRTLSKLLGRPASQVTLPKGWDDIQRFWLKDHGSEVYEPMIISITREEAERLAKRGALVEIPADRPWMATVDAAWIGTAG